MVSTKSTRRRFYLRTLHFAEDLCNTTQPKQLVPILVGQIDILADPQEVV
jgi:hypothetical protein